MYSPKRELGGSGIRADPNTTSERNTAAFMLLAGWSLELLHSTYNMERCDTDSGSLMSTCINKFALSRECPQSWIIFMGRNILYTLLRNYELLIKRIASLAERA